MSEENTTPETPSNEQLLETRKELARELGIKFHPSISLEKLNDKIQAELDKDAEEEQPPAPKVKVESEAQKAARIKAEALKLVRVRVTCMNPAKKEYEGEIFQAGNKLTGTVKKYVHFGVEWHVPQIILNMMRDRQYQTFINKKVRSESGVLVTQKQGKLVPEYAIEVLEPLTGEELKALAQRQAMANGTAAD